MKSQKKSQKNWSSFLEQEFQKPYFKALQAFVSEERKTHTVFPPEEKVFAAFEACPLDRLKVVILGQDPYHGEGQAMGLAFSVPPGVSPPPSLKNIYKELQADLGIPVSKSGDLKEWAHQGVLLLNTTLTVRKGEPLSHAGQGWERFTTSVLSFLIESDEPLVFVLWGNAAKQKYQEAEKEAKKDASFLHLVLIAAHPSPFSAHKFLGCRHFSKLNIFLKEQHITPIDFIIRS